MPAARCVPDEPFGKAGVDRSLTNDNAQGEYYLTDIVAAAVADGVAVVATQPMSVFQAKLLRQWSSEVIYFSQGVHEPDGDDIAAFAARGIRIDRRPVAALASSPAGGVEAVVTDDAAQGINAVVRGVDLLDSTPRQIWLQQRLALGTPSYAHLPVVLNAAGEKLSKQTRAAAVDPSAGSAALSAALRFLGQAVPQEISAGPVRDFWPWAIATWSIRRIPALRGMLPGFPA